MEPLPYIDEHHQRIDVSPTLVWTALLEVLQRDMRAGASFARLLGCDPASGTLTFTGRPGDAVPGFEIVGAEPGRRLALRGQHRFAVYSLTFLLEGDGLRARTHAQFPGVLGRLYHTAVIRSGGHRLVTRRLLRRIARASRALAHAGMLVYS